MLVFVYGLFVMAAMCYLLFVTSEPLEEVGGRLGKLLHLPEDVIASTFQALATSGPEIVMAILAATPFVANEVWKTLQLGEKACSGLLNMSFSAMDNLLGIGCLGIILMLHRKTVTNDEVIAVEPSVKIGLIFYILSSLCLCLFITNSLRPDTLEGGREIMVSTITEVQAWVLMIIGICFIISQFFIPNLVNRRQQKQAEASPGEPQETGDEEEDEDFLLSVKMETRDLNNDTILESLRQEFEYNKISLSDDVSVSVKETDAEWLITDGRDAYSVRKQEDRLNIYKEEKLPTTFFSWLLSLGGNGFIYAFLVFGLVIFVRECLGATFNMAMVGIVSVGGVLIMFTSYVSSFPEFMMTYRYAIAKKKSALLGMLFGSNVIDLAFAGFRAIWLRESMDVYTTGRFQQLFLVYLWCLPALAVLALLGLWTGKLKYKHAYPLVVFYIVYIVSGFILL